MKWVFYLERMIDKNIKNLTIKEKTGNKMKTKITLIVIIAVLAVSMAWLTPVCAAADTHIWDGGTGDWNLNTNWDNNVVPAAGDTAIINSGEVQITPSGIGYGAYVDKLYMTGTFTQSYGYVKGNSSGAYVSEAYVGYNGTGIYNQSSGQTYFTNLYVGSGSNGGSYTNTALSYVTNLSLGATCGPEVLVTYTLGNNLSSSGTGIYLYAGNVSGGAGSTFNYKNGTLSLTGNTFNVGTLNLGNDYSASNVPYISLNNGRVATIDTVDNHSYYSTPFDFGSSGGTCISSDLFGHFSAI
jgi:hypothetical protein